MGPPRPLSRQTARAFPGPHRHPFLLVDRLSTTDGGYAVRVRSAGDRLPGAAAEPLPASLLVEVMAQGALWVLGEGTEGGAAGEDAVRLAGVDDGRFHVPVRTGDRLAVRAEPLGSFGALSKVACRVERDGERVAEARLLLVGPEPGRHGS